MPIATDPQHEKTPVGATSPAEASHVPHASGAGKPRIKPAIEEPELATEADVPSDGKDEEGEAMIRDLPQKPELSEPPSQPSRSS